MKVGYGEDLSGFGPGVRIELTGDEVALAIDAYLEARGVYVAGPRSVTVNGELCSAGEVYVDPSGSVVAGGERFPGKGPEKD